MWRALQQELRRIVLRAWCCPVVVLLECVLRSCVWFEWRTGVRRNASFVCCERRDAPVNVPNCPECFCKSRTIVLSSRVTIVPDFQVLWSLSVGSCALGAGKSESALCNAQHELCRATQSVLFVETTFCQARELGPGECVCEFFKR